MPRVASTRSFEPSVSATINENLPSFHFARTKARRRIWAPGLSLLGLLALGLWPRGLISRATSLSWSAVGHMGEPRYTHTSTLPQNGKVLVAGGLHPGGALATAELYDPATGSWGFTGSMNQARYFRTATRLTNGKVLVVGGLSDQVYLQSAEIYDPLTGNWSATGSLRAGRYLHTATLL